MIKTHFQQILISLILLTSIYLLSAYLQSTLLIGWDPSWGLHETKRMLAGGIDGRDYFEATPPGFLYLYALPVIFAEHTRISLLFIFRCYIFSLATLSLFFCYVLINKIILKKHYLLRISFLLLLGVVFLILPLPYDFGNREHLLLIFSLPYFLLICLRLENHYCAITFAIVIGIFGALGFLIKPFFMISLLGIEAYYFYCKKNRYAWIRPETLIVATITLAYILILYIRFPSYFLITLPLSRDLYYTGYKESWDIVLNQAMLFFCCAAIVLYFIDLKSIYKKLTAVLLIILVSFLISYFLQRTSFYYHLLPAYSVAFLLFIVLIHSLFQDFPITKKHWRFLMIFLMIIFSYPTYLVSERYREGVIYKQKISPITTFLKNKAHHEPVMFFSTMITYEFPAVDYAEAFPASQYGVLSWMVGLLKHPDKNQTYVQEEQNYFINNLANELISNKPKFILIDVQRYKPHLENLAFEYLPFFLRNPSFATAWEHYHYLTTLEDKSFFKFDVYERENT